MNRTVTVVAAASGATADVRLDASVTLADVVPELMRLTGSPRTALTCDGSLLDLRQPVAHLPDGAVLVLGPPAGRSAEPVVTLEVTAGPDAGHRVALPPGRWVLGREGDGGLVLTDPRVSRRHAELAISTGGDVTVTDLYTSNGTSLAVSLEPGRPSAWPAGATLRCGGTRMVHGRSAALAATAAGPDGTTAVNRPPRLHPAMEPVTVTFPVPASPVSTGRLPLLASLAPLLAGVVLALALHRWEFLAFAVMSPLVVLGQAGADRWAARRANRSADRAHAEASAAAERTLTDALTAEAARRHADVPDLAAVVAAAEQRTCLLWHRGATDDDMLTLRLGLGSVLAAVRVEGDDRVPLVHDVPVCLDLRSSRVVGVCGAAPAIALARSLLVQAAALVGPADLAITVLAPGREVSWGWTRWLPHADVALSSEQVRARVEQLRNDADGRHRVVLADGVADTGLAAALATLPHVSTIWVADAELRLPAACDAVVSVTVADPVRAQVRTADTCHYDVAADLMSAAVADRVARALCPLRDGRSVRAAIPSTVAWTDVHDLPLGEETAAQMLLRRWRSGPSTRACLGVGARGPYVVDLQVDGPHLLVAGTTGAGKSELLQSLVASLVAGNSPADLNLLLVDFKGGAAFGPCERLPHTLGVLTDLDPATTTRAIESLTAELRRRERLLAAVGAPDIDTWRARAARDGASEVRLPRLLIVVDEFATLAEELPDFVGGLVGIAQRGRSLGVHLVLATQRPEGAVSADIRANTRLRICLAVARDTESRDVIDSPAAAAISRSTPGRALVRVGSHDLVEIQTARVAGPARTARPGCAVELVPIQAWGESPAGTSADPETEAATELDLLVAAAVEAAGEDRSPVAVRPWLPPLPGTLALSALPSADGGAAVGLLDLPQRQEQPALTLASDDADAVLVVGAARSGRTTAVTTMATALAMASAPDHLQIWAIDSGGGLAPLGELPHTGSVVDTRDVEQVERLLTYLTQEVERRRGTDTSRGPRMLLAVDSWDGFVAATVETDGGRCQDLLLRLLTHAPAAGLRIVLTSDRAGLTGRLSSAVTHRLCLRLADPADYALLGLAPRRVPATMPPGRCIRAGDFALAQFAAVDAPALATARSWPPASTAPRRFDPLPSRVPLHTLRPMGGGGLIVGLGGDDLAPVLVDPEDAGGSFLVAGPPRSGRSTTLVSIAAQLPGRPVVALCARRGPLQQRRDLAYVADPSNADEARAALQAVAAGATLLVDDVDLVDDPAVLDGIEAAVRTARDGHGFVVLAGTTEAMAASFRGPVAQARRGRSGLLLRPDGPHDGELLGVRLRRRPAHGDPPGRGVLAMHGRVVPVQVPDPA